MKRADQKNFSLTRNQGFQMRLPNGYIVSIQFGPMNYCENRSFAKIEAEPDENGLVSSNDAETAVFHSVTDEWVEPPWNEGDQVQGSQSPEDVLQLLEWAANLPDPTKNSE